MEDLIIYLGKVAIATGLFYIVYLTLFQYHKQFAFNRIYLPVSLAISFVIPLITFTTIKYVDPVSTIGIGNSAIIAEGTGFVESETHTLLWYHYLFGLYTLGVLFFGLHFLFGYFRALSIVKKAKNHKIFDADICVTKEDVHPFSFFNKIVLSKQTLNHPNLKMIVNHEDIHVREKHTVDILLTEMMFIAQWFNPFAWLIKDAVKNNLEYITDNRIVQKHNPQAYQMAMLTLADKDGVAPFLTALNGSQLKNRIIMMKRKKRSRYTFLKQLVVLPLLAILVMGLSNREVKTEMKELTPEVVASDSIKVKAKLSGKVLTEKGDILDSVKIYNKFGAMLATTDSKGAFSFDYEKKKDVILLIKSGYKLKYLDIDLTKKDKQNIEVQLDVNPVKRKVVIGYPIVKTDTTISNKEVIVNSYGKQKSYHKDSMGNLESGLNTLTNSNKPPLYVVDGKITNSINGIAPEQIDEVSVLKGEAGVELYGEKGKNGVVLIKLKEQINLKSKDNVVVVGYSEHKNMEGSSQQSNLNLPVIRLKSTKSMIDQPLYIVDGKEVDEINSINPNYIASISVLKEKSATELYGEKGNNGVVLVTMKDTDWKEPVYYLDGKEIDRSEAYKYLSRQTIIKDVIKLKKEEAVAKYGKKGENGVVEIYTKESPSTIDKLFDYDSSKGKPLFIINGIETNVSINQLDAKYIESVTVLKDESATKKYGDKGKNGVIIVKLKEGIVFPPDNSSAKNRKMITTISDLHRALAMNIIYPLEAQEKSLEGVVTVYVKVEENGGITEIPTTKKPSGVDMLLEEMIVTALVKEDTKRTQDNNSKILSKAAAYAIVRILPLIKIPELKGKVIGIPVRFVLQVIA